jgi:hypothetical protein
MYIVISKPNRNSVAAGVCHFMIDTPVFDAFEPLGSPCDFVPRVGAGTEHSLRDRAMMRMDAAGNPAS